MDINSVAVTLQKNIAESKQQKEEEIAIQFEKIFARKMVKELTKDSFKMGDNKGLMGQSNSLYRQHIVDTFANQIAAQKKLGMADMITKYMR